MKLTNEEVARLGVLSRIEIPAEVLAGLTEDLNRILDFAAVLQEIDPGLPEYGFPAGGNILRHDILRPPLGQEQALAAAPSSQDGFLKVPRTVDSGGHGA